MLFHIHLICTILYTIGSLCVLSSAGIVVAQSEESDSIYVLFLGNSLTSGYGLSVNEAYPAVLQKRVDSLKWSVAMINAGVSGDTSSGGLRRLEWYLEVPPDILVLALGANDGLRGISPSLTRTNLTQIIQKTREANPKVGILIAGMEVPPNLGPTFQEEFRSIFPSVVEELDVALIPFLLEGVGGVTELNQSDGIHPTAAGQRKLADNVWEVLEPVLRKYIPR
ncbi:MAG: arylesterase [Bacteroidetes bacterium]|nr:arylesterase [Bacteroidota bacterium]MCY4204576.1 arylesterase [Bacteroidota bacterium]